MPQLHRQPGRYSEAEAGEEHWRKSAYRYKVRVPAIRCGWLGKNPLGFLEEAEPAKRACEIRKIKKSMANTYNIVA
jgi:hypothetical protein